MEDKWLIGVKGVIVFSLCIVINVDFNDEQKS